MNILKNHPSVLLLSNLTTAPPASKTENGNEVFLSFNHKQTSSRPEVFCKKGVLNICAKFTRKQLCHSLFFNKVAGLMPLLK